LAAGSSSSSRPPGKHKICIVTGAAMIANIITRYVPVLAVFTQHVFSR
jgi:hypothetical protein